MADIANSPASRSIRKIRSKKISTRIDMTPMVDLAFLLLTFFVLTAALTKPFVMPIAMPEDSPEAQMPINVNRALTLVLGSHDKIYWFKGVGPEVRVSDFSANGIRKVILEQNRLGKKPYVFIKAADESRYQNLVDILDEMVITDVKHYAVTDLTEADKELIAQRE